MKHLFEERIVKIPAECKVSLQDKVFTFEGPLGKQKYDVSKQFFTFEIDEGVIRIKSWHGNKHKHDMLGTIAAHIKNNLIGVVKGYKFVLKAAYRRFSITIIIENNGKTVVIKNFLGTKDILTFPVLGDAKAMMGESKDIIIIQGTNLDDVSQTAARISNTCAKRKKHDQRIFLDGIFVTERVPIAE